MKSGRKGSLLKLLLSVLLFVTVTLTAIAGYLLYNDSFNSLMFSDWLFYAAIAYIFLAVIPLYDVITSSNSVSYTYGEYAVKGKIDNQSRVDDSHTKRSYSFSIIAIATSIMLFIGAFIAERFF